MQSDNDKKQIKQALKSEVSPLLIGLRNELKNLGDKIEKLVGKEPPEIQKTEITNYPEAPEVSKVEVTNQPEPVKEIKVSNFPEPQEEIKVKGIDLLFANLYSKFWSLNTYIAENLKSFGETLKEQIFRVKVENPTEVKFPDVQKVEVTNQTKQAEEIRVSNRNPEDAIPVVLTAKDRKRFYDVMFQAIGGGSNLDNVKKLLEQIDASINNLDINIGDIDVNLDEVEFLLGKDVFHQYAEASIASATETDVVTYTVPTGKKARIWRIHASGEATAKFRLKVNSTIVATGRIAWTDRNWNPHFDPVEVAAGSTIKITALHQQGASRNYEGTIAGILL